MGKKKKSNVEKEPQPYCWYCERKFEDEKVLVAHQKAKHFKCHMCHKKLSTASGMVVHVFQVHKENITKVPNSLPGKESVQYEIYGMEGIPNGETEDEEGPSKKQKVEALVSAPLLPTPPAGTAFTAPVPSFPPTFPPTGQPPLFAAPNWGGPYPGPNGMPPTAQTPPAPGASATITSPPAMSRPPPLFPIGMPPHMGGIMPPPGYSMPGMMGSGPLLPSGGPNQPQSHLPPHMLHPPPAPHPGGPPQPPPHLASHQPPPQPTTLTGQPSHIGQPPHLGPPHLMINQPQSNQSHLLGPSPGRGILPPPPHAGMQHLMSPPQPHMVHQQQAAAPPPVPQQPAAYLVYDDEGTSMEEKRAENARYRYDEEKIKQQMKTLEQSIEYRVSKIGSRIGL